MTGAGELTIHHDTTPTLIRAWGAASVLRGDWFVNPSESDTLRIWA